MLWYANPVVSGVRYSDGDNYVQAKRVPTPESPPDQADYSPIWDEVSLCNYLDLLGISFAKQHKKVMVVADNRREGEYLRALINSRCADPHGRFEVIWEDR